MKSNIKLIIEKLKEQNKIESLSQGLHGLEREGLRVDAEANISQKDHPKSLGDKFTDPHITTDFAESQLEIITPAFATIDTSVDCLKQLHKKVIQGLDNEYIWPFSMPTVLPSDEKIVIAKFGSDEQAQQKEIYRKGLALRAGKTSQMISGIHYNFSFSEELWDFFHLESQTNMTKQAFKNNRLLALKKSLSNWIWFIVYCTGASPIKHASYTCSRIDTLTDHNPVSLRMSSCGYKNTVPIDIDYTSFDTYTTSIKKATKTPHQPYTDLGIYDKHGNQQQLNDNIFQIANEYYSPIRIKPKPGKGTFLDGLMSTGAEYLELRMIDTNPFYATGVDPKALKFIHLLTVFCFLDLPAIGTPLPMNNHTIKKIENIAIAGGKELPATDKIKVEKLLLELKAMSAYFPAQYTDAVSHYYEALSNTKLLPWSKIKKDTTNKDFLSYGQELIQKNLEQLTA